MKYSIYFLTLVISVNSSVFAANGNAGGTSNNLIQSTLTGEDATPVAGKGGSGFILEIDNSTDRESMITTNAQYTGGAGAGNGDGGYGLQINDPTSLGLNSLTNNSVLVGGIGTNITTSIGGNGLFLDTIDITTVTNNGNIIGGDASRGGNALYIRNNSNIGTVVNTGLISGGNNTHGNAGGRAGAGIAIETDSSATIQNSGTIIGGNSLGSNRAGHGIYVHESDAVIENTGIISGGTADTGNGGKAVMIETSGTINLVNSGIIQGGTGGINPIAVQLGTSGNRIELQSGGQFIGELYALGGTGNQAFVINANKESAANTFNLSQLTGTGWNSSTFEKTGAYDWVLSNTTTNNIITNWTISQGNLIVGATANGGTAINGTVDINSGTLSGFGIIKDRVTVASGGTVSPGNNSLGTLTVGDIIFESGSTYAVQANPDNTNDLLQVTATGTNGTGTATINGGTVVVNAGAGTWQANTLYTILVADNNLATTDRFDGVNVDLAFLNAELNYDVANQVNLVLTRNSAGFADIAITRNQKQTASGIGSLANTNPIVTEILSMNAAGARNAYDNLSGEIHASAQAALLNDRYVRDAINEHLLDRFETKGSGLWFTTWGSTENLGSDNNAAKASNNVFGMMLGTDTDLNETTKVGLAIGYQHNNIDINKERRSNAEIDSYHLAAYLGKEFGYGISLRTGLDYAYLNIRTDRRVEVGNIKEKNQDSYHGNWLQSFIEVSKKVQINSQLQVEPYVNLAHVYINTRINEGNKVTALKGSGENQATFSTTGLRGKFNATNKVKLVLGAGWQHAYGNLKADTDLRFNGSSYFNINGAPITRDAIITNIGAEYNLTPNATLGVSYQGQFGNKIEVNAIKAGINYRF